MRTEAKIVHSGFRVQASGFRKRETVGREYPTSHIPHPISQWGRSGWLAVLALGLLAGCASPPAAQFTDGDWVSQSTTGRGSYDRGDYRRAADAYGRAEQRARALDDADALAVAAVNRAVCLLAEGKAREALAGVDEALADARVSKARQAELKVAGARASVALGKSEEASVPSGRGADTRSFVHVAGTGLAGEERSGIGSRRQFRGGEDALGRALREGMVEAPRASPCGTGGTPGENGGGGTSARRMPCESLTNRPRCGKKPAACRRWPGPWPRRGSRPRPPGDLAGACDRFYRAARSLWAQGLQPRPFVRWRKAYPVRKQLGGRDMLRSEWQSCL